MEKALREAAKLLALDFARSECARKYCSSDRGINGPSYDKLQDQTFFYNMILTAPEYIVKEMERILTELEVPRYSKEWGETHAYALRVYFNEIGKNARRKLGI